MALLFSFFSVCVFVNACQCAYNRIKANIGRYRLTGPIDCVLEKSRKSFLFLSGWEIESFFWVSAPSYRGARMPHSKHPPPTTHPHGMFTSHVLLCEVTRKKTWRTARNITAIILFKIFPPCEICTRSRESSMVALPHHIFPFDPVSDTLCHGHLQEVISDKTCQHTDTLSWHFMSGHETFKFSVLA